MALDFSLTRNVSEDYYPAVLGKPINFQVVGETSARWPGFQVVRRTAEALSPEKIMVSSLKMQNIRSRSRYFIKTGSEALHQGRITGNREKHE